MTESGALFSSSSPRPRDEFYTVLNHELEDLQNSRITPMNHVSTHLKRNEQNIFKNENINKETKIELQGHTSNQVT